MHFHLIEKNTNVIKGLSIRIISVKRIMSLFRFLLTHYITKSNPKNLAILQFTLNLRIKQTIKELKVTKQYSGKNLKRELYYRIEIVIKPPSPIIIEIQKHIILDQIFLNKIE